MKIKKHTLSVVLYTTIPALLISLFFWMHSDRKKKEYHRRYLELEQAREKTSLDKTKDSTQPPKAHILEESIPFQKLRARANTINAEIEKKILQHLQKFEEQHLFLEKGVTIQKLADRWNTNRTYISYCINTYKGRNFVDYIHSLRICHFTT